MEHGLLVHILAIFLLLCYIHIYIYILMYILMSIVAFVALPHDCHSDKYLRGETDTDRSILLGEGSKIILEKMCQNSGGKASGSSTSNLQKRSMAATRFYLPTSIACGEWFVSFNVEDVGFWGQVRISLLSICLQLYDR